MCACAYVRACARARVCVCVCVCVSITSLVIRYNKMLFLPINIRGKLCKARNGEQVWKKLRVVDGDRIKIKRKKEKKKQKKNRKKQKKHRKKKEKKEKENNGTEHQTVKLNRSRHCRRIVFYYRHVVRGSVA